MANEWHYTLNGQQAAAPASPAQLKQLAASGQLQPTDLIWKEGMANWVPASSIKGLFGSSVSVSPAKAAPPPMVAEDVAPADYDDGAPRRSAGGGGGGDLFKRIISLNLSTAPVAAGERQQLAAAGIAGDAAQRYLAWRRSMLILVAVITFAAAVWNTVFLFANDFFSEKLPISGLGKMLEGLYLLSVFGLFGAALVGVLLWSKLKFTRFLLAVAWLFSIGMPLLMLFTPATWLISISVPKELANIPGAADMAKQRAAGIGAILGLAFFVPQLLPAVVSAGPGLIRGSLRVKSLLPGATVPGWVVVATAPLSGLVVLGVVLFSFSLLSLMGTVGGALLMIGLILLILAPFAYLVWGSKLVRPLRRSEAGSLAIMEAAAAGVAALGAILVIVFFLTLGSDKEDKKGNAPSGRGAPAAEKKEGPPSPTGIAIRVWVDYLGRSLFMSVVAADFLLGGVVLGWRNMQRYAKTQDGPAHEQALTELEVLTTPPAAEKKRSRVIEPGDYPPEDEG